MTTLNYTNTLPDGMDTPAIGSPPPGGSNSSGSLTQGGINPSASAMLMLYQVMKLYSEITGITAEQQKSQVTAQQIQGKASGDAIKAAGHAAMVAAIVGGVLAIAGVALSLGMQMVGSKAASEQSRNAANLEREAVPMKAISELDQTQPAQAGVRAGPNGQAVTARATDLKNGVYAGNEEHNEAALQALKNTPADYEAFKARLEMRIDTHERALNTANMSIQTKTQTYNNIGQQIGTTAQSANSISQGAGQSAQAAENSYDALNRSAAQMSGSAASSLQGAQSKAADAQNAVMNVLNAIRQSSSNV